MRRIDVTLSPAELEAAASPFLALIQQQIAAGVPYDKLVVALGFVLGTALGVRGIRIDGTAPVAGQLDAVLQGHIHGATRLALYNAGQPAPTSAP